MSLRTTVFAFEKKQNIKYFDCVIFSFMYPACNAHAPYCHQWLAVFYKIPPDILVNGTNFEGKILNLKSVFRISVQSLSETLFILRRTERDIVNNVYRS
jgi:hypothetical protein